MPQKRQKLDAKNKPGDLRAVFASEYLIDRNGTQAAIRAGYSPKTAGSQAARLLKDVRVLALIEAGEKKLEDATVATALERRQFWTKVMRKGRDVQARLKASELLGKARGDFVERHEITGNGFTLQIHDAPKKA